ncbi:MAG: condensation domain-containing protein [Bacteroidia bacterium]
MSNIEKIFPLAPMQESLLFAHFSMPESRAYYQQVVVQFRGELNVPCLIQTLEHLIAKYEVFRTIYVTEKVKQAMQVVVKMRKVTLNTLDISDKEVEEQDILLEKHTKEEINQAFDLAKDLLLRFLLIKTGENQHIFIWTYHHILMDGWGRQKIWQDFMETYFLLAQKMTLPPLKKQSYQPYVDWLKLQNKENQRLFWKNYLTTWQEQTSLPQIHFSAEKGYDFAQSSVELSEELVQKLKKIAQDAQTTLNVLCNVAWAYLLHHYTQKKHALFRHCKICFSSKFK